MNTIEIKKVLLKRGNTAQSEAYTGLLGEVTIDTDLNCLRIHDGVTPGGEIVAVTATTTQALIEQAISDLLNGAPEALDTLKELADALGNNSNSITDILTTLSSKANIVDLATVAQTGSYNDLTDTPAPFSGLGDLEISGSNITGTDGVVRLQTQNVTQTAYYNFTPSAGYSTAVWNNNGITFNDPTQEIYTAIWALTDLSTVEIQINGQWQTVTYGGSSTPGWPAAPTLWLQETAVNGPLNIDVVDITIRQGTESYVEVDGSDFTVDVQDDIRIYGNDIFRLVNRSADNSIEIETNDGEYTWAFRPDGGLDLPDGGDIFRNGISVIPNLATVATSGSYNDLADTPTIPEPVNLTPGVVGLDVNGFMFYDAGTQTITANWSHYYLTNVHIFKSSLPSDFNTTVDDAWTLNGIPVVSVQTWSSNTDQWEITLASNYDGAQPSVFFKEVAGAYVGLPNGGVLDTADSNIEVRGINNFNIEADNVVNIVTDAQGAGHQWQFGDNGDLSMPNGLTVIGGAPSLLVATGNNLSIGTSRYETVSANAYIGSGDLFSAWTEFDDDITVVQVGWIVSIGGTDYTVTEVDDSVGFQYRITVAGATFVTGTNYTFRNPIPVPSAWVFGNDGVLTTPGSGTIGHQNNDLKLEVSGSDVIVLRTGGGDVYVDAFGRLVLGSVITGDNSNGYINLAGPANDVIIANDSAPVVIRVYDDNGINPDKDWIFGVQGGITFPDSTTQTTAWTGSYTPTTISSGLTAPGSAVVATADKVNFNFSDMVGTAVSIDRSSRISSPKSDGLTLASNFDVRIIADYTDNDRTWTFNGTDGSLTAPGDITTTGNITAANFIGNISITGNVTGTSANVELVAGSYTWTFDNTGTMTAPAMGGDEGGEIRFGVPETNTTLSNGVSVDVFQNRFRIFEGSNDAKGAYIDLSQAGAGVGTLLNNRVSAFVDAGTFVTMDNIKATVTSSGLRGLSLATTTGSITYNISATYGGTGGSGGSSLNAQTLTTTATSSIFGWNFGAEGEASTYVLVDKTNNRSYRITLSIGPAYLSNMISIERLV